MKDALAELSGEVGREIEVRARPGIHQEHFEVLALGEAEPVELEVPWLVGRGMNGAAVDLADEEDDDEVPANGSDRAETPEESTTEAAPPREDPAAAGPEGAGEGGEGEEKEAKDTGSTRPAPFSDLSSFETLSIASLAAEDDEPDGEDEADSESSDASPAKLSASGEPVDATPEFRILPRSGESEEA